MRHEANSPIYPPASSFAVGTGSIVALMQDMRARLARIADALVDGEGDLAAAIIEGLETDLRKAAAALEGVEIA